MGHIFISYDSDDRHQAQLLAETLKSYGWSVWWDREIPIGGVFDEVIEEALDAAACVIVLWSERSVSSRWVKSEAAEGIERNILIPVLIDEVKLPLEFRRIQAVRLVGWRGEFSPEFNRLLREIASRISSPSTSNRVEGVEGGAASGDVAEQEGVRRGAGQPPVEAEAGRRHLRDSLVGTVWVYRWRDRDFEFGFGESGRLQILRSWEGVLWRAVGPTSVIFDAPNGTHMFLQLDETLCTFTTHDWDGRAAVGRRTNKRLTR